jgi:DNA mismatch repair protein MutS2
MMLQPVELLNVAVTLGAARRLKTFFQRFEGAGKTGMAAPLLCARAAKITPLKHSEDAVHAVVDATGEVKDSASPALRRIRKLIARTRDEIMDRMSRILRDSGAQNIVQDQVITVRDDRYVMPLKPNFRQGIKGVVHGHSASRATVFVEPLEVLEQNNRLAELRMEEREEVERVLRELTSLLARDAAGIGSTLDAAAGIDAIAARARFGTEYQGTVPELSAKRRLHLRAARHPLIIAKQKSGAAQNVVPNDIDLSDTGRTLIISGPNAGGKTVILKTIGLLCLMAQAGIPVTATEGSELPVFGDLFADIGDEQSLEMDLSTFSSHVRQIAGILREATSDSLVLLDELGSGTDPAEGGALGAAVLASLQESGCVSVVTTHHNVLKLFGARTEGAVNAAMEFDPATLQPTYRFLTGRPGRSYGLDMASRLGIPDDVVRDARARLSRDEASLDRLLEQVEQDARQLRAERQRAEQELSTAQRLKSEAEQLHRTASEEARTAKAKAKQEARETLTGLRQKLKELSRVVVIDRGQVERERREINALARQLEPIEEEPTTGEPIYRGKIHPGDRVRMPKLKRTGTVLFAHHDELEVDADGLKLKIASRDAVPLEQTAATRQDGRNSGWSSDVEEREGLPDRVNLLGLRVDEALAETERFLDGASVKGLHQVIIIHGLGTGALKAAVTGLLKDHPLVASFRTGEPAEGGAGVTAAELKR